MIVIIGAGIAGLSLGWELASAGEEVTTVEAKKVANGASGAAGAYLEPRPGSGKLRALEWASHSMWPKYAQELEQQSGRGIDFQTKGMTHIGYAENLEKLKRAAEFHRTSNRDVTWMEYTDLQKFEPCLSNEVVAGFHLPQVHQTDARKTCKALAIAFQKQGGTLIEGAKVNQLSQQGEKIQLSTSDGASLATDKLVITAGFGTSSISGLPNDIPASRPVRGIMVEMEPVVDRPTLRHPVKRPEGIILPIANGNLLVGSSHEEGETALEAPKELVTPMLESACRAVPAIDDMRVVEKRVGIRALIGDGLLRLGQSGENPDIYYSLSHAGAGFLRAPLIARELAGIITGAAVAPEYISPFFKPSKTHRP